MAVIIPNVTNWSVTPQNGQEDYFTKMNIWLSESTNVISSLSTAITKINESNSESNSNLNQVLTARDQTVAARNEAVTAVATLSAGAIDNTNIAPNKAFSNQYIKNNYYNKTEVDDKININGFTNKITPANIDNFGIQEDGGLFKKLSWANLKATLKTYFDTLYNNWVANDSRVKTALNASGAAPIYACRAWVSFDGTGTVAIRTSRNVSSITDNGVGNYTINFTTAMIYSTYSVVGSATGLGTNTGWFSYGNTIRTTSSVDILISNLGAGGSTYTPIDRADISVAIIE